MELDAPASPLQADESMLMIMEIELDFAYGGTIHTDMNPEISQGFDFFRIKSLIYIWPRPPKLVWCERSLDITGRMYCQFMITIKS